MEPNRNTWEEEKNQLMSNIKSLTDEWSGRGFAMFYRALEAYTETITRKKDYRHTLELRQHDEEVRERRNQELLIIMHEAEAEGWDFNRFINNFAALLSNQKQS